MPKKASKAGSKKAVRSAPPEVTDVSENAPETEIAAPGLDEVQTYLAHMEAERGYLLDWHKTLAAHDFEFLKGYNGLLEAAYTRPRLLDVKTKEMVITAVLMAVRSQPSHIKTHLEMCKKFGATAQEMLEVLEVVLPPAGVPAFMHSFDLWRQVYDIEQD